MDRRSILRWLLAAPVACATSMAKGDGFTLKTDEQLKQALRSPQSLMFSDQATDRVDSHAFIKVRSVATNDAGKVDYVEVRPGTMRIFRADSSKTADGAGELRWTIGKEERKTHIKEPGAVIMVVRSLDGTVNWYSLQYDLRC